MKVTEIKTWKDLSSFVFDRLIGVDKSEVSDEEWETLNKNSLPILNNVSIDEVQSKAKKVMNVNILDKNINFKFFEKIPNVWNTYYWTSIGIVAAVSGQII